MSIQARVASLNHTLCHLLQIPDTIPEPEAEQLMSDLDVLTSQLSLTDPAIRQLHDLNGALALLLQLLDAAHTEKVDAEKVRCLLEPIRERFELSTGELSRVLS